MCVCVHLPCDDEAADPLTFSSSPKTGGFWLVRVECLDDDKWLEIQFHCCTSFFLISVFSTVAKKNDIQRTRIGAGDSRISVHHRFVERNGKFFLISFHEEKKKKRVSVSLLVIPLCKLVESLYNRRIENKRHFLETFFFFRMCWIILLARCSLFDSLEDNDRNTTRNPTK